MPIETFPYDTARYLDTDDAVAAYIEAVLEDGDPALVAEAIGVVARARGMSEIARETGLSRESLYRSLSKQGNPEFATILKVLKAVGVRLSATPGALSDRA
ncbi:MAG: FIG045511: hypothetical antitoxin (to FIG022160: hypothetical toxin) [uncultured Microvirga sp.]|uniref:FIG045511: hypothetical antitoxin (To FIG022160: hypothetical toxin) n=1 Tax=uncultured Microvirga sp. TaxID=412392 RepID=A0A6J4LYI4_9HYPH|nr:MAG: FIG045511: hypothetical antitoxin (to FIG022160: hypothetical toxin) [uncultured Microvirga sp.]